MCSSLYTIKEDSAILGKFTGGIMDRETKVGFVCMFVMVFSAIAFPIILKAMGAW